LVKLVSFKTQFSALAETSFMSENVKPIGGNRLKKTWTVIQFYFLVSVYCFPLTPPGGTGTPENNKKHALRAGCLFCHRSANFISWTSGSSCL